MQWSVEAPLTGAAMLALIFVFTGLIPIPRTLLCIASGVFFGLIAIPIILPSTTLGGIICFMLARHFLAETLRRLAVRRPGLRSLLEAVDSEGWRILALVRFGSPVPTVAQNYLFGLTRMNVWLFAATTFIFTIPQVCLYVYLGAIGRAALLEDSYSFLSLTLMIIAGLSFLSALMLVMRRAGRALKAVDANVSPPN
jgi:uncharacterized membrane protein YdjX (TVP38/TMEM64 family)